MSAPSYYWQGGRKIAIEQDRSAVTIHADDEHQALAAADEAGVRLREVRPSASGLVRAEIEADRDEGMRRLREHNIVHHVYRDAQDPGREVLITDSFFLKFKDGTPAAKIAQYLQEESLVVEQDHGNNLLLVRVTTATGLPSGPGISSMISSRI